MSATESSAKRVAIAVAGGRDYNPTTSELQAFRFCFRRLGGTILLHGDARGVDRAVAAYARRHGIEVQAIPAEWELYGKAAGPIRNQVLVAACIALVAFPGGRGTADAVDKARRLGRPVHRISDELELLRLDTQRDHNT